MATFTTTHYEIFEYWKDRCLDKLLTKEVPSIEHRIVWDEGNPCCWACGKPVFRHDKIKTNGDVELKRLWNDPDVKSKLERCHIVPRALGGSDEPSNLFLLCPECHTLSPDTTNPTNFYRWVATRRENYWWGKLSPVAILKGVEESLATRGMPTLRELLSLVDAGRVDEDSLSKFANGRVGTHCSAVSDSTIIATATDWILNLWVDGLLSD